MAPHEDLTLNLLRIIVIKVEKNVTGPLALPIISGLIAEEVQLQGHSVLLVRCIPLSLSSEHQ